MKLPSWTWSILVLAILALPIFACLDTLPIQLWDESRLAINAFELYKSKNWLVTTYNDQPDMWNTKPPLLIWFQVIFFKLFGISELTLRLPSAIAGALTCLALYTFLSKKLYRPATGVLAVIILVSSAGFIKYHHSPRTGDYDALLTYFSTLYCIFYFRYLDEDRRKFLLLSLVFMTLAVMTKTIAGLLFTPGLFLYTLYKKKLLTTLKAPQLYIGITIFICVVVGYYYIHEQHTPGYFQAVMDNDLLGRYNTSGTIYGRGNSNFFFYLELATQKYFNYWYILAIIGAIAGMSAADKKIKDVTAFSLILSSSFLIIISQGQVKNDWYDMPAYPFLSLLAAIGIWFICQLLLRIDFTGLISTKKAVILFAFVAAVTFTPYFVSLGSSLNPDAGTWIAQNTNICSYLKDKYHGQLSKTDSIIVLKDNDYHANVEWYVKVLNNKGAYARIIGLNQLDSFSQVVAFQPHIKKQLKNNYNNEVLEENRYGIVTVYKLHGRKTAENMVGIQTDSLSH